MKIKLSGLLLLLVFCATSVFAQSGEVTITYKRGDNIREIAREYLGDPDLWQEILYANGLNSVDELADGTLLKITPDDILTSSKLKQEAREKIDNANKAGAGFLVPETIKNSVDSFNAGIEFAKRGEWEKSIGKFRESIKISDEALTEIEKKRIVDSEAFLSFRRGRVEKRKPEERLWADAPLNTKLYVEDRARTLSDSYAEISFTDKSKVRLNANSQAVIKKSRLDLISNKSENSVRLEKGEAFALFSKGTRKKNDFEVPGVDVKVNSSFFWVEKNTDDTKFANYEGEIELTSQDSSVTLARNQGSVIPKDGVPSKPVELLDPPVLVSPEPGAEIYSAEFSFSWQPVDQAKEYILLISRDTDREDIVRSIKQISGTTVSVSNLEPDYYYFNVATVDENGFPGPYGEARAIRVIRDETKPYLVINSPENNLFTNQKEIVISGETEDDITITLNGRNVETEGKSFRTNYSLTEGYNKLEFKAVDKAGNVTDIIREVILETGGSLKINYNPGMNKKAPGVFITPTPTMSFSGNTSAQASVDLTGVNNSTRLRSYADNNGDFNFMLSGLKHENIFALDVASQGGNRFSDTVKVIYENLKPVIRLENNLPPVTTESSYEISGTVENADVIFVNGNKIPAGSKRFRVVIPLEEGNNRIEIEAVNPAGNKTNYSGQIKLDSTPPEVTGEEFSRVQKGNNTYLIIKVIVNDESQLKKNAVAEITSSSFSATKYLSLVGNKDTYYGEVPLPEHAADKSMNIEIHLEDYPGNSTVYSTVK